jgi:hypothetical protein
MSAPVEFINPAELQALLGDSSSLSNNLSSLVFRQEHRYFCGVAMIQAVLNSKTPNRAESQFDLIHWEEVSRVRKPQEILFEEGPYPGLAIEDLYQIFLNFNLKAELIYGDKLDSNLLLNKISSSEFAILNFLGTKLGLQSRGHWAFSGPIRDQQVLVLDPAVHFNPWFWADAPALVEAMNTKREPTELVRGILCLNS